MRLFSIDPTKIAVLMVDLQKCYCDPQGEMALREGWDCRPMQEVCNRHIPFVSALRDLLPAPQIIWVRRVPHGRGTKTDENLAFLDSLKPGGFSYHLVQPNPGEAEALKAHPSVFHIHARVRTVGLRKISLRQGEDMCLRGPMHINDYMDAIGVNTLAVTGVLGPHCVYASIVGASIFDRRCLCVTDLIAVPGGKAFQEEAEVHARTRDSFYATPVTSKTLLSALRSGSVALKPKVAGRTPE